MSGSFAHVQIRQRGVILIVALIFMTVLGLLVLAGMRTGLLQERMASNARNRQVALQSAEAMLRDAEINTVKSKVAPVPVAKRVAGPSPSGNRIASARRAW